MKFVQITHTVHGTVLGTRVEVADRMWPRIRGLIGRPALRPGEGLLLKGCRAVHTVGMTYPLDVAFLDRRNVIVRQYLRLPTGRRTSWHRAAADALELPAGTLAAADVREGDALSVLPLSAVAPTGPRSASEVRG